MSEVMHINNENFDAEVLESDLPVIVDFWAPWCNPCKALAPILDKVAREYGGKVKVAKVNTDEQPQLAERYSILNIPSLKIFHRGELVDEFTGLTTRQNIEKMIDPLIEE